MTHGLLIPLVLGLGPSELLIIVAIIVLLFGAKKLPELARGSGRALRIFKAETKGLLDDDNVDDDIKTPEQRQIDSRNRAAAEAAEHRTAAEAAERRAAGHDDPGAPGAL